MSNCLNTDEAIEIVKTFRLYLNYSISKQANEAFTFSRKDMPNGEQELFELVISEQKHAFENVMKTIDSIAKGNSVKILGYSDILNRLWCPPRVKKS
jgi:hypothetical protein